MRRRVFFDDWRSLLHMVFAALVTALSPCASVSATIAYTAYQLVEREALDWKRGDFLEWMAGIAAGALARALVYGAG